MRFTAYEIALIAGGFTVLGTLLGAWLTFRFSLSLSRINSQKAAGMRLRDAFAPDAVTDFAFFLTRDEFKRFDKAWKEYCTYKDPNKKDWDQYIGQPELAVDRIYAILEFTKKWS